MADTFAIHAAGEAQNVDNLSRWRMKPSDVLLLQGRHADIDRLDTHSLMPLDDVSAHHPRTSKGWIATAIFLIAIVLGATRIFPLPIAFLAGAVAMEQTGAAHWLAGHVITIIGPLGGYAVMCAFGLLTIVLTQPMSNQAAALVVLPIAIEASRQLGLDPRTMVIAVTLAASLSFLTPLEPACLLVYGPGRYRFFDFVRVGLPLTVITYAITMQMVPLVWPLMAAN